MILGRSSSGRGRTWHAHVCVVVFALSWATITHAADGPPLPDAPLRLVIADVGAFDAALGGSFRAALTGNLPDDDPAYAAWRQTQVGAKLIAQWQKLEADLPWTWEQITALGARRLGLALLDVGHLETVLAISTPLAALPTPLAKGTARTHGAITYQLVAAGAGDAGATGANAGAGAATEDGERRMGLVWARAGEWLLIATSERALIAALDELAAGRGFAAPLSGLVSMELDLDRLRADRYFKREFLFPPGPETGRVRAALRQEGRGFVEVREGSHEPRAVGYEFDPARAIAAGWEADGSLLWPTLRRGVLEPVPNPADLPQVSLGVLPAATVEKSDDRYLVSFLRPIVPAGLPSTDEGELAEWREWLARNPVAGFAFVLARDGSRLLGVPWPAARDDELVALARATAARRAGRIDVASVGDAREIRAGADLPLVAIRRVGELVWIGPSATALAAAPAARRSAERVRWARVDLGAVRAEAPRWERAEGPAAPEQVRALSDRVVGLLRWIPSVGSISVERRLTQNGGGWIERVDFTPPAKP